MLVTPRESQQPSCMFFPHPPRDIDFSDVSLKTLLVLVLHSIFHLSHVYLLGGFIGSPNLIIAIPDLIVASRNGLRTVSLWAAAWATTTLLRIDSRRTDELAKCNDLSFSSASLTMFSTSLSVSLYAAHTRMSPPNRIHRNVLQPFALPRRVIAFTSRRTVHICGNRDLIDRIELSLCLAQQSFSELSHRAVSSDAVHPSEPTSPKCYQYHNHHLC